MAAKKGTVISLLIMPGVITLTLTPAAASSIAKVLARVAIADLEAA